MEFCPLYHRIPDYTFGKLEHIIFDRVFHRLSTYLLLYSQPIYIEIY